MTGHGSCSLIISLLTLLYLQFLYSSLLCLWSSIFKNIEMSRVSSNSEEKYQKHMALFCGSYDDTIARLKSSIIISRLGLYMAIGFASTATATAAATLAAATTTTTATASIMATAAAAATLATATAAATPGCKGFSYGVIRHHIRCYYGK
jgi:high-affinity nickel permease